MSLISQTGGSKIHYLNVIQSHNYHQAGREECQKDHCTLGGQPSATLLLSWIFRLAQYACSIAIPVARWKFFTTKYQPQSCDIESQRFGIGSSDIRICTYWINSYNTNILTGMIYCSTGLVSHSWRSQVGNGQICHDRLDTTWRGKYGHSHMYSYYCSIAHVSRYEQVLKIHLL